MDDLDDLVLDFGSGFSSVGYSGDDCPRGNFPTIVGELSGEHWVGDYALMKKYGNLNISNVVDRGVVRDWNLMEKLMNHSFDFELRIDTSLSRFFVTQAPLNPREEREKYSSLLFEKYNGKGVYFSSSALTSLYSYGETTGVVVGCGQEVSYSCPIEDMEDGEIENATVRSDFGGKQVTEYLSKLLFQKGKHVSKKEKWGNLVVEEIKKGVGKVCLDKGKLLWNDKNCGIKTYELPDGENLKVGSERFGAPEILFDSSSGIQSLVMQSIGRVKSRTLRKDLWSKIYLSGGSTLFKGFTERLLRELESCSKGSGPIPKAKVLGRPDRRYSNWIGASMISCLSSMNWKWITKKDYDEEGFRIILKRCKGQFGKVGIHFWKELPKNLLQKQLAQFVSTELNLHRFCDLKVCCHGSTSSLERNSKQKTD